MDCAAKNPYGSIHGTFRPGTLPLGSARRAASSFAAAAEKCPSLGLAAKAICVRAEKPSGGLPACGSWLEGPPAAAVSSGDFLPAAWGLAAAGGCGSGWW